MKVTPSSLVMGYMRLGDGYTAAIGFAAWSKGMPAASPTASAARTAEVQCVPHSRVLTTTEWPWWTAVKDSSSGQVERRCYARSMAPSRRPKVRMLHGARGDVRSEERRRG